jgi:hypothetical protein
MYVDIVVCKCIKIFSSTKTSSTYVLGNTLDIFVYLLRPEQHGQLNVARESVEGHSAVQPDRVDLVTQRFLKNVEKFRELGSTKKFRELGSTKKFRELGSTEKFRELGSTEKFRDLVSNSLNFQSGKQLL